MYRCGNGKCHNLNLGFMIKARIYKGASQEWSLEITFHAFESVGECEKMNPHNFKWTLEFLEGNYKGQNLLD